MKIKSALPWLTATLATAALVLGASAYSLAATTAGSASSQQPQAASRVVPGVWPVQDHTVSWNAKISPREQSTFMFGSSQAAAAAQVVYDSAAWAPTTAERHAAQNAWDACLVDAHGSFLVTRSYAAAGIEPSDCQAFWSGSMRGQQLEAVFG